MNAAFTMGTMKQCQYAAVIRDKLHKYMADWRDQEIARLPREQIARKLFIADMVDELLESRDSVKWITLFGQCTLRNRPADIGLMQKILADRVGECDITAVRLKLDADLAAEDKLRRDAIDEAGREFRDASQQATFEHNRNTVRLRREAEERIEAIKRLTEPPKPLAPWEGPSEWPEEETARLRTESTLRIGPRERASR